MRSKFAHPRLSQEAKALLFSILLIVMISWINFATSSGNSHQRIRMDDSPDNLYVRKHKTNVHMPKNDDNHVENSPENRLLEAMMTSPLKFGTSPVINFTKEAEFTKKILFWNDFYFTKNFGFKQASLWEYGCPYKNCHMTENKSLYDLRVIDAVMWHPRSLDIRVPDLRGMKAKLVFFDVETPGNLRLNLRPIKKKFDLTFTYRADSDIPYPSGMVVRRRKPNDTFATKDFHSNKTFMAVWFTSHCPTDSRRDTLAETLERYNISVHKYGRCGDLNCPIELEGDYCLKMVEDMYFFYYSFENSLCQDYLTEKIFHLLKYNMIPIVYGMGPYKRYLPPHSYIDVFDFNSIEDLSKYMKYLTKNATAYNEYFRWKVHMEIIEGEVVNALSLCQLCKVLNQDPPRKVTDVENWFVTKSRCIEGSEQPVSSFINGSRLDEPFNKYLQRTKDKSELFDTYMTKIRDMYENL